MIIWLEKKVIWDLNLILLVAYWLLTEYFPALCHVLPQWYCYACLKCPFMCHCWYFYIRRHVCSGLFSINLEVFCFSETILVLITKSAFKLTPCPHQHRHSLKTESSVSFRHQEYTYLNLYFKIYSMALATQSQIMPPKLQQIWN